MAAMRIALVQWAPVPGDPARNLVDALRGIDEAAERGADLIVLPELWDSGCGPGLADDVRAAAEPLDGPRGTAPPLAPRRRVLRDGPHRHGAAAIASPCGDAAQRGLADSGRAAIARLEEGPVDLLISDIQMPDMNGVEVLRAAKRLDADVLGIMIKIGRAHV